MIGECELCGSKNANRKVKIDEAILNVCGNCVKFGEEIRQIEIRIKRQIPTLEESKEVIKHNFQNIVKNSREKLNLTQKQLAKRLNEKSSIIKRIEDGWEPPPHLIRKIEKLFNIKLTEEMEEKQLDKKTEKKKLTIGDIVEVS